jgi:uncharacterized protein (UPF0147 family)/membrane protein implicated in regulation of membrane protease activity
MKKVTISVITTAAVALQLLPPVLAEHGKWIFPILTAIMFGIAVYFVLYFVEEMLRKRAKESDELKKTIDNLSERISVAEKSIVGKMEIQIQKTDDIKSSVVQKMAENIASVSKVQEGLAILKSQNDNSNNELLQSFSELGNNFSSVEKSIANKLDEQTKQAQENAKTHDSLYNTANEKLLNAFSVLGNNLSSVEKSIANRLDEQTKQVQENAKTHNSMYNTANEKLLNAFSELGTNLSSVEKSIANKLDEQTKQAQENAETHNSLYNTANEKLLNAFSELGNKITADSEIPAKIEETGTEISDKLNDAINYLQTRLSDNLGTLKESLKDSQSAIKRELGYYSHNSTDAISNAIKECGEQNKATSKKVCDAIEDFSAKFDAAVSPIKAAAKLSDEEKKLMETLAKSLK